MSQAGIINVAGGGGGGSPVQTLTGDDGEPAVPVANNINILTDDESDNNNNGIRSQSAFPTPDDVTIFLTNRITGTATTTDAATTQTVYSFPLGATPGTYILEVQVIGYDVTDGLSAGYNSTRVIRTNGSAAFLISANPGIIAEENNGITDMNDVVVVNSISGNNATLTVNGIEGKTINWRALTMYIFVS